jgi:riboflavin biosynthesis pyrimidine reductase
MSEPLLECLMDATGPVPGRFPDLLRALYDGDCEIASPHVYANFVSSVDGVVAVETRRNSGSIISGRNQADRFVMGLLRAFADAVVVGAGTFRAEGHGALWTPEFIYPAAADAFAALRRDLGLAASPRLCLLTVSGDLDPAEPAIKAGPIVVAPAAHAALIRQRMPAAAEVLTLGEGRLVDPGGLLQLLRSRGYERILCEGGPTTFGGMVRSRLVDELFLTISPVLAGRDNAASRLGLMENARLPADSFAHLELRSLRRSASYLFLRYALR